MAATFGAEAKKGGDRRRRAFVYVRRPHVERHGRDLEGDAGEDEHQAEQLARGHAIAAERDGDFAEQGRAGEAVEQRHAVEQDAGGKRAEDEIFEACFRRA
jgi:hypothetical protein